MIRIAWRPLRTLRAEERELLRRAGPPSAALGRNGRPESASPKALTPGASSAAMRPGPRRSSMISWRSAAVAQPAPKATSSAVVPLTCGTPHRSRVIVTPCAGRSSCDRTLPGREAERLPLEEPAQIGGLDVVAQARETLVERDLVGRVLREGDAARLARREHVPRLRGVVRAAPLRATAPAATSRRTQTAAATRARRGGGSLAGPFGARSNVAGKGTCEPYICRADGRARPLRGRAALAAPRRRSSCAATGRAAPPSSSPGRRRSRASPPRSAALAWGAAAGWDDRVVPGLLPVRRAAHRGAARRGLAPAGRASGGPAPVALVYAGLAVGVALAVPIDPPVRGSAIPDASAHLDALPGARARARRQRRRHGRGGRDRARGHSATAGRQRA